MRNFMLLQVKNDGTKISFISPELNVYGSTDYTEEAWKIISKYNWYINDNELDKGKRVYINTGSSPFGKRYRKLHEVVMCLWYGKKVVEEFRDNKYIIEHHNNDPYDCTIENLSFAHQDLNKVKAFSFDKERKNLIHDVAINIFKIFDNQEYQITLAFNKEYVLTLGEDEEKRKLPLNNLYLFYYDDFQTVLYDCMRITKNFLNNQTVHINKLECFDYKYETANYIYAVKGVEIPPIFEYEGKHYLTLNNKYKTKIFSASPLKNRH